VRKLKKTRTEYVTLHFPLLHLDVTYAEQRKKVVEEYNEFRKELFAESSHERTLHELQDIVQAYITMMVAQVRELALDERDASERVTALVEHLNQVHRKKIERYKAERGWQ
jgi:allophanate hydrolase subunit 1